MIASTETQPVTESQARPKPILKLIKPVKSRMSQEIELRNWIIGKYVQSGETKLAYDICEHVNFNVPTPILYALATQSYNTGQYQQATDIATKINYHDLPVETQREFLGMVSSLENKIKTEA